MLTGNEIRDQFLKFFKGHGHSIVPSSSLIPHNDPTLFFTNAGMVQFKDLFLGQEKRDYQTATTCQKCMRVSGKHNDLENVGRTPRHHTFFEMLGNFSFGNYFKKDAIAYAWEFLIKTLNIPWELLWISVYTDDDEAAEIWNKGMGVTPSRIIRLGEKENFWSMGDTGPCGPCSEIHVDMKALLTGEYAKGTPETNDKDFMEIWNLVFMQFERGKDGKLTPLPKPSIDTGMGLERLATVLQKKKSNYDTDLFQPLIQKIAETTKKTYLNNPDEDVSMRVLADHLRASVFLISDGVQPSNEGRGYVLRRIMRRAIRHGKMLGQNSPFFYSLVPTLIKEMGGAYSDIVKNETFVTKVIKNEEERFLETLDHGLKKIDEEISSLKKSGNKIFNGKLAFELYDTFGFPPDLTELIATENKLEVDLKTFESEMLAQKTRARASWKGSGQQTASKVYHELAMKQKTNFVGYQHTEAQGKILAILVDGVLSQEASEGATVELITDTTPLYGESGGQVGDQGTIVGKNGTAQIEDTQKPVDGLFVHQGKITLGAVKVGDSVTLKVNDATRRPVMLNHTATHILHAALREILGDHVKQAGSLVEPDKLRFDFSHFEPLTRDQIEKIELRVNEVIRANYTVTKEEMSLDDAKKKGALAFFGDKYGERVRVVTIGPYSMEFCGGTHLNASGEIGIFKITSEASVASGVRRIEATTGLGALRLFKDFESTLINGSNLLKTSQKDFLPRLEKLMDEKKQLEKEIQHLKTKLASGNSGGSGDAMSQVKEIKGIKLLAIEVELDDPKAARDLGDQLKNKIGSGIIVLGTKGNDKVTLTVMVTKDLLSKYNAGKIAAELAAVVGGKGGGRPDMAQAGGPDVSKLKDALEKAASLI